MINFYLISKIKLKYDTKKTNYKYWAQNTAFNMLVDGFDNDKKDNQITNQITNQPINQPINHVGNHPGNQKGKNNISVTIYRPALLGTYIVV